MRGNRIFTNSCFWCFPGIILILSAGCIQASDTLTGTISGRAQDLTGAALEGVKVTLSDETGHPVATTTTASTGAYVLDMVKAGKYELRAERTGFRPTVPTKVDLTVQQKVIVTLILQPLQASTARRNQETSNLAQPGKAVGYYESSSLKADEFAGSVDPGGYSAPGNADATNHLLEGAATLRQDSSDRLDGKPDKGTEASSHFPDLREMELKNAVERNPQSFEANHNLGKLYLGAGRPEWAVPYLEKTYRFDPSDRANAYDLAVAYLKTGNLSAAKHVVRTMIERSDTAELHTLLAEVEEKTGNFAEATKEYQRAAQDEPSEKNIFDWGAELLLHRAIEPASGVFRSGVGRYPKSAEMWIGLGIALYLGGNYDEAIRSLVQATDLNPADYRPYIFLADAYTTSQRETVAVTERLKRFAELYPHDARAVYYYALSLWKGLRGKIPLAGLEQVEALLKKSSTLDPKFPEAHLQLGVLHASQQKYPDAIEQYRQAIELDSGLAEAHYKLGQALARTGRNEQAEQEFEAYERLHQQHAAASEENRRSR